MQKSVLITGCSSGIGLESALELKRQGFHVLAGCRKPDDVEEPDSGFNPFQMAPRLMMNLADVDKTGAVQPGSRVTWRYKFGGNENQLDGYEKWLLPQLKPEQRWYGLEQDEGALGRSMERSQQFLLLSALLTLLLAVAAVAVAMNHYCRSRYDLVAILKTLGGRASATA